MGKCTTLNITAAAVAALLNVTAGTAAASKALVLDANLDVGSLRTMTFTGTATSISVTAGTQGYPAIYVRDGSLKIHKHTATTDTYCAEFKFNYQGATAQSFGLDCTCEIEPGGDTPANRTAGGLRAVQGVARVGSGFTLTGGGDSGVYGQFCNNGTINGTVYPSAGYMLIENGGTWTEVGVLSAMWLDSHLNKTISAGASYFLNITNNGESTPTAFDAAVHVYAGNAITNLLKIDTASGMVSANTVGDATFANWKTIKVDLDGTTHYLIAAQAITG